MRRVSVLLLVLALIVGVSAAGTLDGSVSSQDIPVKGSYAGSEYVAPVYSVDVVWGSMEFTYNAGEIVQTWDPETHSYVTSNAKTPTWSCETGANQIQVTNRSNIGLVARITTSVNSTYSGITATVDHPQLDLPSAAANATTVQAGTATTGTATVTLSGTLASDTVSNTVIGAVTLVIEDKK